MPSPTDCLVCACEPVECIKQLDALNWPWVSPQPQEVQLSRRTIASYALSRLHRPVLLYPSGTTAAIEDYMQVYGTRWYKQHST